MDHLIIRHEASSKGGSQSQILTLYDRRVCVCVFVCENVMRLPGTSSRASDAVEEGEGGEEEEEGPSYKRHDTAVAWDARFLCSLFPPPPAPSSPPHLDAPPSSSCWHCCKRVDVGKKFDAGISHKGDGGVGGNIRNGVCCPSLPACVWQGKKKPALCNSKLNELPQTHDLHLGQAAGRFILSMRPGSGSSHKFKRDPLCVCVCAECWERDCLRLLHFQD